MNTSLPEMLHYLNTPDNFNRNAHGGGAKMSVLERQQTRVKWQQQEQLIQEQPPILPPLQQLLPMDYFQDFSHDQNLGGLLFAKAMKLDPNYGVTDLGMNCSVARTASCPPGAISEVATKGKESVLPEKLSSSAGRESFKKRKADNNQNSKVVATEEESKDKKLKGSIEEKEAKLTEQKSTSKNTDNNNNSKTEPSDTSKENSKVSEVQKPDYIHVRARRGQATDSHSLAERARREKISEKMKYLQDLVPGCNKITGKAGVLDEIINYVESLQRQVEFLSMKIAAVNPKLDFNIDNLIFPSTTSDSLQQVVSCCGLEIGIETSEMALRRTMSALVSIPEVLTVTESPCFNHIQPCNSNWDAELQNLYSVEFQQTRPPLLPQPCTGFVGGSSVKMEM